MKSFKLQNALQIATSLLMVASLGVAVGAKADEVGDMAVRTVQYSDLNLNTQAGVATLYKRIHVAAAEVCGDVDSKRLNEAAAAQACVRKAVYSSVNAINNTKLTNEYRAHYGVAGQETTNVASR